MKRMLEDNEIVEDNENIINIKKTKKHKINKLVIITDVEPDDYLALIIIIEYFIENEIPFKNLLIVTTLMNANKKKLLIENLLSTYNIKDDIVCVGQNGLKKPYDKEGN
jgi:hypothetical protein